MQHRLQRVIVETERHRLVGSLTLPTDGYRSRLFDFLNSSDRDFLALTDVEVQPLSAETQTVRRAFVAVSRRHVVLAMPLEEDAAEEDAAD